MEAPRSTAGAPLDLLVELVQSLRRELGRRGEAPAGEWVETSAAELRSGAKVGWYYPPGSGGGLGFYASRGGEAYGHVHAGEGPEAGNRALDLARTVLDSLPASVRSIDIGFTGLAADRESEMLRTLAERPGSTVIERLALVRDLTPSDGETRPSVPPGVELIAARSVTLEAIADLDRRAFSGTVDELLVGPSPEDYRRVVAALFDGRLGRFLDEASTALVTGEPPVLAGTLLSGEQSPQQAIFLEFLVDPAYRGRGYGRFLLAWGFRALWALGYSTVRLWVTAGNAPARHLYAATGFRPFASAAIYRWERSAEAPHRQSVR